MAIWRIDETNEPKPKREFRFCGRPTEAVKEIIEEHNNWMFTRYANHGNVAAHIFGELHDQINKLRDREFKLIFHKDGRSLNRFITRGMYFCGATVRNFDLRFRKQLTPDATGLTNYEWGYYLTPIMYLYDIQDIYKLVRKRLATYFETMIPTYSHTYLDNVHEFRVHNRNALPNPTLIIVGKNSNPLKASQRIDIERLHKHAKCDILHIPHLRLILGKGENSTGNEVCSTNAIRVIQCIRHLRN